MVFKTPDWVVAGISVTPEGARFSINGFPLPANNFTTVYTNQPVDPMDLVVPFAVSWATMKDGFNLLADIDYSQYGFVNPNTGLWNDTHLIVTTSGDVIPMSTHPDQGIVYQLGHDYAQGTPETTWAPYTYDEDEIADAFQERFGVDVSEYEVLGGGLEIDYAEDSFHTLYLNYGGFQGSGENVGTWSQMGCYPVPLDDTDLWTEARNTILQWTGNVKLLDTPIEGIMREYQMCL